MARDTSRYPFVPLGLPSLVVGGEGNHLILEDGRRILDGAGGAIVNCVGYGRPEIAEAAAQVLDGRGYVLPTWATEARLALIERLLDDWLPDGMARALIVSGGSESVDTAMRVARQHHTARGNGDKWKILGRQISYHGSTLATLAVANHDRRREHFGQLLLEMAKIDALDAEAAIKQIEAEDPSTVAAVIGEPISGASGAALTPDAEYWPALREYCTQNDILLIIDEVMTGVGRTGTRFGIEHWAVRPDILVGSKGLGGGYAPVGGVFATEEVVAPMTSPVMYFTFSGSDVSCAIADRVLQIIEDEQLVDRAGRMGEVMIGKLRDRLGAHPHVADIRGKGLLIGIELTKDAETGASFNGELTNAVMTEALARDTWIYPAGSAGVPDGLLFGPAYTVTDDEIDQLVDVTADSIDAALEQLA